MINSRDLSDLDPVAREVASEHVRVCRNIGIELLITSTYRDFEAQEDLYAVGRTKDLDRKRVTDAKAGESWHNFRCAYDVVPLVGGKAVWNDAALWKKIEECGKSVGAERGPSWDQPHFQVRPSKDMTIHVAYETFLKQGTIFPV